MLRPERPIERLDVLFRVRSVCKAGVGATSRRDGCVPPEGGHADGERVRRLCENTVDKPIRIGRRR